MKTQKTKNEICAKCGKTKEKHFGRNVRVRHPINHAKYGRVMTTGVEYVLFCSKTGNKKFTPIQDSSHEPEEKTDEVYSHQVSESLRQSSGTFQDRILKQKIKKGLEKTNLLKQFEEMKKIPLNKLKDKYGELDIVMFIVYGLGIGYGQQKTIQEIQGMIKIFFGVKRNWAKKPETSLNKALVELCNGWEQELLKKLKEMREGK